MEKNKRFAVGIDLGGTFIKYSIVCSDGQMLLYDKLPARAQEGADAIVEQLVEAVNRCRKSADGQGLTLDGVGIGTPGIISADGRTILGGAENLKGWQNIPIAEIMEQRTGLPTLANNDANLMALAETMFGSAKGSTDVVFLTIGTGIGGGVLIDGKLYGGYRNRGTELGHITIKYDGEKCACGNIGCLETYASTGALVRRFAERCRRAGIERPDADGHKIVELYKQGDVQAVEALNEHWEFLGYGIAGIVNTFSPQRIVIGGGISEAGDFYIRNIEKAVRKFALEESVRETEFVAASLGNGSGCQGAAGLILSKPA